MGLGLECNTNLSSQVQRTTHLINKPELLSIFFLSNQRIMALNKVLSFPTAPDSQRFRRNDRAMFRWICSVKPHEEVPMETLYTELGIQEVAVAPKLNV